LSETPKHFSFSADCAGVVMLAKAEVSAAAIASEVMVLLVIGYVSRLETLAIER
jgi:hypothetical protein